MSGPNVYTIPAGQPFAKTLAGQLFAETKGAPEALSNIRILLPTRRACRVLREAFLQISDGKPLLLPRMQPLGDIDEEELSLSIAGEDAGLLDLPPSISPLRRQLLLARTIEALPDFDQSPAQALSLAQALGRLMDQIYTENLDFADLDKLVPAEFASHWQITVDFLKILSEHWPKILAEEGVIDIADRRNRLMLTLSEFWQKHPPDYPVIAAGSTGSIPATAKLLSTIADLPQGKVILPGLDQDMDEESWDSLDETHPQFGLRELLGHMNLLRQNVQQWPEQVEHEISAARRAFSTEIMRPATTTKAWIELGGDKNRRAEFEKSFTNLLRFTCEHEREEADTIAVLMRSILEEDGKTAALITPDRTLARRVAESCKRWGITLDDSAGQSLDNSRLGLFMQLGLQACLSQLSPVPLLALLKHELYSIMAQDTLQELEHYLRGPKPRPGFNGLRTQLEAKNASKPLLEAVGTLEKKLEPLWHLSQGRKSESFESLLDAHIQVIESLSKNPLWAGDEGENAAALCANLLDQAHLVQPLTLQQYAEVFEQFLQSVTVRPSYGTHPRLMILGQLEARLINADLVILGGLNEGTWPPADAHDPWMSRPMRKEFGLPSQERGIGLAAHDFVQGFCAPSVVLTRAKRTQGTPTVPARWLQRMDAVLQAAGLELPEDSSYQLWARHLDDPDEVTPAQRPAPKPPVPARPRKISATRIETWLKDPYGIYARYVLKLEKLKPLEEKADSALKGTILHGLLEDFVRTYPDELPDEPEQILFQMAEKQLDLHNQNPEDWRYWWPRLGRINDWFIEQEQTWRAQAKPLKTETEGRISLKTTGEDFEISAKADRIDKLPNGAAVIDYKSSGQFSAKDIKTGAQPQLPATALIIAKGGFEDIQPQLAQLGYWVLTGAARAGKTTIVDEDLEEIVQETEEGLMALIHAFDKEETPYYSLPRLDRAPRFNDYEHLARVKEWASLSDQEEAA